MPTNKFFSSALISCYTSTVRINKMIIPDEFRFQRLFQASLYISRLLTSLLFLIKSLHWLKINERIKYKRLSLTYKVLTNQPQYLHTRLQLLTLSLFTLQRCRDTISTMMKRRTAATNYDRMDRICRDVVATAAV